MGRFFDGVIYSAALCVMLATIALAKRAEQQAKRHEAEPGSAIGIGDRRTEEIGTGQGLPERAVVGRLARLERLHSLVGRLIFEDLARQFRYRLLFFSKAEVHAQSL